MKKKGDIWMPLYITDYFGDTTHLTTAQHGAYLLLLMSCWKGSATLPDDDVMLSQIVRCDLKTWRAMRPVIAEFFDIEDGAWTQKRLTAEYVKAGGIVDKRRQAGKVGAAKRWGKPDGEDDGGGNGKPIASVMANAMANGSQTASQTDAPSPSPTPKTKNPESSLVGINTIAPPAEAAESDPKGDPPPDPTPPSTATRQGLVSAMLRKLGVQITPGNPHLVGWVQAGVTDEMLREAVARVRIHKPEPEPIPPNYLAKTVLSVMHPPTIATVTASDPTLVPRWWESEAATTEQAKRLGMHARGGEGWPEFRQRIRERLATPRTEAA